MFRIAFVIAILAWCSSVATARCAMWGLVPRVVTPAETEIPSDGGIVVAAVPDPHGKLDSGDAAVVPTWRYRSTTANPQIETLAPGLAVYRAAGATGTELQDGDGAKLVRVKPIRGQRVRLPAPLVRTVTIDSSIGRGLATRVDVDLAVIPSGAVAIVLADAKGAPRSWGMIHRLSPAELATTKRPMAVTVYESRRCIPLPNGTVPSQLGDKVVTYFVDEAGRTSSTSESHEIIRPRASP
ncbi:MAG: hypothetical protein H6Q90_4925 [Deltaproteobacteria bacterium]|nr:hypothetical protein [Deltaproteobacteria bacterium]